LATREASKRRGREKRLLAQGYCADAKLLRESRVWPEYKSTWPGCTWMNLYLHPVALNHQLEMMIIVPFELGELYRQKRLPAMHN